ncbi:MAG: methyltransferase domain-containing protein [Gammaproteobacteria bacterium]|nr:methyltransferase domain-containing protein [Gammaproteobacteria bacterium]
MKQFIRDDGVALALHPEIKSNILSRPSANPKHNWTDEDYINGAQIKLQRWKNRLAGLNSLGVELEGKRVLEVACGNGIDSILMALEPVKRVIGIDICLRLQLADKKGKRHRKLATEILAAVGKKPSLWENLCELPIYFTEADATNLVFDKNSFDLILSKSFLEHMIPLEAALEEMYRVLAPGGLMYHVIDPYYWLRGCHAPVLVDIPWAHARLSSDEFKRFVTETEGVETAEKRSKWNDSLNHFTPRDYRAIFEASDFEIVSWKEKKAAFVEDILEKHPDVLETLIDGISRDDLLCTGIKVLVKKKCH